MFFDHNCNIVSKHSFQQRFTLNIIHYHTFNFCIFSRLSSAIFSRMRLARSCSPMLAPRCARYSLVSLMRQVRIVWSMVYDFLPFCTVFQSQNYSLDAQILNCFMQSLSGGSWLLLPVTPIISGSNIEMNFLIFSGESLSGSTETKIVLRLKNFPSLDFLTLATALLTLVSELGQMSGQCVNPKQMRQQVPARSWLLNGFPSVSVSCHSPPICAFPDPVCLTSELSDFFFLLARMTCISMYAYARANARPLARSMVFPNLLGQTPSYSYIFRLLLFQPYCLGCIQASMAYSLMGAGDGFLLSYAKEKRRGVVSLGVQMKGVRLDERALMGWISLAILEIIYIIIVENSNIPSYSTHSSYQKTTLYITFSFLKVLLI